MLPRLCLALLAPLWLACPALAQDKKKPNLVIVLADDLGYGDLGCYGHAVIKTPHLDELAKKALLFKHGYSAGAVCSPSRSAILTGRTPYRNGVFDWIPAGSPVHLRNSEISLATLLRGLGYATCHVGKWHLNGLFNSPKQPQPGDHGFDWWLATQNNADPSHKNPVNFVRNGKALGVAKGFSSAIIVDEAIQWLKKERDPDKPFFLNVWFHEPHLPIETAGTFQELYPDLMANDPDAAQHHGNVSQLDFAVGKLLRALEALGLEENTVIVFTSDNGPEGPGGTGRNRGSTGGLRGRKRSVYQGGIRVPFMIAWPGHVPAGKTTNTPVVGTDLFPTFLAIAGGKVPDDRTIDGVSLLPVLAGKKLDRAIPLYWRCAIAPGPFKIAMRQEDYHLLADVRLAQFELYNLAADAGEKVNLVEREPQVFERMRARLERLNAEIEKEGPTWWRKTGKGK